MDKDSKRKEFKDSCMYLCAKMKKMIINYRIVMSG